MTSNDRTVYKIIFIGDSGVGKTAILQKVVDNKFSQNYRATVGADFFAKRVKINSYKSVELQLWDTAGQEKYMALNSCFYRGTDVCVLCYDVTNTQLDFWKKQFLEYGLPKGKDRFPFIVLGNKIDKEQNRKIPYIKANMWCKSQGQFPLLEVSAKNNENLEYAFNVIAQLASKREENEEKLFVPDYALKNFQNQKSKYNQGNCC